VTAPLRGDGPCLEKGGPPTLTRDSTLGGLSDVAGPQLASPAKSIKLRSSARRGHSRHRQDRDGRMSSDLSGGAGDGGSGTVRARVLLLRRCAGCWPETNRPVYMPRTGRPTRRRDDGRAGRCRRCEYVQAGARPRGERKALTAAEIHVANTLKCHVRFIRYLELACEECHVHQDAVLCQIPLT
jgi:hypothetical protein